MESVSIGGKLYVDPDVLKLVRETGQLVDPRSAVATKARRLNERFVKLGGDDRDPMARLRILASLCGVEVKAMDSGHAERYSRDAIPVPLAGGGRRVILYNPSRPKGRIAFSIAHEIAHTFFPNTGAGARFRTTCAPESRGANELERLCDLAASELLMPLSRFRAMVGTHFGLDGVKAAAAHFGSSFESTAFRMATAHPRAAVAGLLTFRRRVGEEAALKTPGTQTRLFGGPARAAAPAAPRYRRQSFFTSDSCGTEHLIPWNKSFAPDSIVYVAGRQRVLASSAERLPNRAATIGRIEAMPAPYQRRADAELPDVLFLWTA